MTVVSCLILFFIGMAVRYRERVNVAISEFLSRKSSDSLRTTIAAVTIVVEEFLPRGAYGKLPKFVSFHDWRRYMQCHSKAAYAELQDAYEIACCMSGIFADLVDFTQTSAIVNGSPLCKQVTTYLESVGRAELLFFSFLLSRPLKKDLFDMGPDVIRDLVVLLTQVMAVLYHVCWAISAILVPNSLKRSHSIATRKIRRISNFQLRAHLVLRIVHERLLVMDGILTKRGGRSDFSYEFSHASSFRQFLSETIFITSEYVRSGQSLGDPLTQRRVETFVQPHPEPPRLVHEVMRFTIIPPDPPKVEPPPKPVPPPAPKKKRNWLCLPSGKDRRGSS